MLLNSQGGIGKLTTIILLTFVTIVWMAYCLFLKHPQGTAGFRISEQPALAKIICYSVQTTILFAKSNYPPGNLTSSLICWILLGWCLGGSAVCIYFKLSKFEYSNERVEYAYLVGFLCQLSVAVGSMISKSCPQTEGILIVVVLLGAVVLMHWQGII